MRSSSAVLLAAVMSLWSACASTRTSSVIADRYDASTDRTELIVVPYGTVNLPGKWTKLSYDAASRQHFFTNVDSVVVAVAKQPKEKYPFYSKEQSDVQFISEFHKWEADYWTGQGLSTRVVEDRSADGVIIWKVIGEQVNTTFLFGAKGNYAYNLSVSAGAWDDGTTQQFLKDLYASN